MITADSRVAAEAGLEILRQGGNAVDAAVATGFALAVTHPLAGNIGGGGFMVIRLADGTTAALDYRETAPLAATPTMYLDESGEKVRSSEVGHLAVAVPGSVAGLAAAQERFGPLDLADVMAPAIRLAEEGFEVDPLLSMALGHSAPVLTRFGGSDIFYDDGAPMATGTRLVQPDLARTLRTIAAGRTRSTR
jgi:gamma-glutamyltranspeptidase / glutathione hydrolase